MTEQEFFHKVQRIGGQAYLVGGAVRAQVLAFPSQDRDYLVCGVEGELFHRAFPESRLLGRSFPVFRLEIDGALCEVALARKERKTGPGSRGFKVDFSPQVTLEEDLFRRDCTVNAMALDGRGRLIDPYGGQADGEAKILRALGDHFPEDPLRALRAARQAAQFGLTIEPRTLALMGLCGPELALEAPERKFQELRRALELPQPSGYFRNLQAAGLLEQEFPWIHRLRGQPQPAQYHPEGDAYDHSLAVLDALALRCPRPEVRFAALVQFTCSERGAFQLVHQIARSLRLPKRWRTWALLALEVPGILKISQPGESRAALLRLQRSGLAPQDLADLIGSRTPGGTSPAPLWLREARSLMEAMKYAGPVPAHLRGPERGQWIGHQEAAQLKEALDRYGQPAAAPLEGIFFEEEPPDG